MTPRRTIALLALALLASACGLANTLPVRNPGLRGEWLSVSGNRQGAHTELRISFSENGEYSSDLSGYGQEGLPAAEVAGYTRSVGTFRIRGERLELKIIRSVEWQKFAARPTPTGSLTPDAPRSYTETYERVK